MSGRIRLQTLLQYLRFRLRMRLCNDVCLRRVLAILQILEFNPKGKSVTSLLASEHDVELFLSQGFLLARGLFEQTEVELLSKYARADQALAQSATSRADAQGGKTTLALSNELPDNLYSVVVRSERIVRTMERLLGEEVYHYHHKMMLKEPFVGGAWEWHQDYGYWYDYGCLYPTMGSCFVAVDRCNVENGCLQVIPGSHHLGRINHMKVGGQTGADPERVSAVLERMPIEHIAMEPGDGLFFHGNLLHRSDQNTSPHPRWSLISCYNTKSNSPYKESRHPNYSPLATVDDDSFESEANRHLEGIQNTGENGS